MQGIKIIVEAVDRATRPIRNIGGALRNINLAPLRDQLGRVMSAAKGVGAEIGRMARNVAIGISGLAVGAGALLARVVRGSNEAAIAAERVGMSMQAFQGIGYAAQREGAEIADMGDSFKDLNLKVLEALNGNDELRDGFRKMGVDLRDAQGNIRSTEDIFIDMADAFAKVPDGAKKSAAAIALMGEAGLKMIPLLNRGSASLRDTMEEAERLGLVVDEETAAGFKALSQDIVRLQGASTGLQNAIGAKLLPVVAPLVSGITEWIVANRELIATNVLGWIEKLPGLIADARLEADEWIETLRPLASAIGTIVEWLGPFNTGVGFFAALVAGKVLLVLWPLIRAFAGLGRVVAQMTLLPLLGMFKTFFVALKAGTGVMAAFNAVMLANPIGLVVAAVAALAGAAYLIYRNWESVGPWFGRLWDSVERRFNGVVEFIKGVFTLDFERAWNGLKEIVLGWRDWIVTIWSGVYEAFHAFTTWLDNTFGTNLTASLESVKGAAVGVAEYFVGLWEPVKLAWQTFVDWVTGTFGPILQGALDLADRVANAVPSLPAFGPSSSPAPAAGRNSDARFVGDVPVGGTLPAPSDALVFERGRAPVAGGGGASMDVGGRLDININSEGRITSSRVQMNDKRVGADVSTGLSAVMP